MTKRRIQRLLLGFVFVPLATAIGLEVGARVVDRVRGKPWNAEASRAWIENTCQMLARRPFGVEPTDGSKTNRLLLQPYFGWEYETTQDFIAEELRWFDDEKKSKSVYDVYIVGGSVAAVFVKFGHQRFLERLKQDPRFRDRRVRVRNFAAGGYKQPQQATLVAYLFALGLEPDAVIDIDGFNEAALGWQNADAGTHPLYPSVSHWANAAQSAGYDSDLGEKTHRVRTTQERASAFGEWFLRSGTWKSCFLDHVFSLRLLALHNEYARAHRRLLDTTKAVQDATIAGPPFAAEPDAIARTIVDDWVESSFNLRAMCKERGIVYLHVLQPTLHDDGSKPLTQREIDGGKIPASWLKGVQIVYPLLRAAAPRLEDRGVSFLDASGVFRDHPEDLYYDLCHFDGPGNEILADAIAAKFLALVPP